MQVQQGTWQCCWAIRRWFRSLVQSSPHPMLAFPMNYGLLTLSQLYESPSVHYNKMTLHWGPSNYNSERVYGDFTSFQPICPESTTSNHWFHHSFWKWQSCNWHHNHTFRGLPMNAGIPRTSQWYFQPPLFGHFFPCRMDRFVFLNATKLFHLLQKVLTFYDYKTCEKPFSS